MDARQNQWLTGRQAAKPVDLKNKLSASEKSKVDLEQRHDELLDELASAKDSPKRFRLIRVSFLSSSYL